MSTDKKVMRVDLTPDLRPALREEKILDFPEKSAKCPPTSDYIDLAAGMSLLDERIAELHAHRKECTYCQSRYDAQRAAVERLAALRQAAPGRSVLDRLAPELLGRGKKLLEAEIAGQTWMGTTLVLDLAAASPVVSMATSLAPMKRKSGVGTLNALVLFSPSTEAANVEPRWRLLVSLPTRDKDPERGNTTEALELLRGYSARLSFVSSRWSEPCPVRVKLDWNLDRTELVSDVIPLNIDNPRDIEMMRLRPTEAVVEPDVG